MLQAEKDVYAFMQAMGQRLPRVPDMDPDPALIDLRTALITEEFDETIDALLHLKRPDLTPAQRLFWTAEVADGVADLIYVAVGTTLALGIEMADIWQDVHDSNMAKTTGPVRADGKRLKPDDWEPPQVERIIREQLAESDFADRSIS